MKQTNSIIWHVMLYRLEWQLGVFILLNFDNMMGHVRIFTPVAVPHSLA